MLVHPTYGEEYGDDEVVAAAAPALADAALAEVAALAVVP